MILFQYVIFFFNISVKYDPEIDIHPLDVQITILLINIFN